MAERNLDALHVRVIPVLLLKQTRTDTLSDGKRAAAGIRSACSGLTGGGILRRLKTRVSPRLREAMVGRRPSEASSSLCQPMLSRPSRYRLQSSELKLQPLRFATASRRRRSNAGHCGGRVTRVSIKEGQL